MFRTVAVPAVELCDESNPEKEREDMLPKPPT
jgi:hypothetical protein